WAAGAVAGRGGRSGSRREATSIPARSSTPVSASAGPASRTRSGSASGRSGSPARFESFPRLTGATVPGKECGPPGMIQVEQLSKYYGARAAIRNLSFRIDAGEVVGFLGLNGAGKTTTLRILGCVLLPTSGTVRLAGQDLLTAPRQLKARIGFLPEAPPLYEDMTVGEYLAFVAGLRSVEAGRIPARVGETEERTGLAALDDERISTLSHGFRQRVGVAQALVHAPDVLLLDEPANGLDPVQNVEMRSLIRSLRGDHTVLVSSHILPEI